MSNIGKNYILIPNNTKVEINNQYIITVGKLGVLIKEIPEELVIKAHDNKLYLSTRYIESEFRTATSLWGTFRSIINNMLIGVSKGFTAKLNVLGIGYRVYTENNTIRLKLGYANTIKLPIPKDISVKCVGNNVIYIHGNDINSVKQYASYIRSYKKPDPYKGKGILFHDEKVIFKEGKKNNL